MIRKCFWMDLGPKPIFEGKKLKQSRFVWRELKKIKQSLFVRQKQKYVRIFPYMKVEQGRGLISKCEREKTQIKSLENENENKKRI